MPVLKGKQALALSRDGEVMPLALSGCDGGKRETRNVFNVPQKAPQGLAYLHCDAERGNRPQTKLVTQRSNSYPEIDSTLAQMPIYRR